MVIGFGTVIACIGGLCLSSTVAVASADPAFSTVTGSPFTSGSAPRSVAFSPSGTLFAVANYGSGANSVSLFTVQASTGNLTPVTGSPFSAGSGSRPFSVSFSPSGNFLATANNASNSISVFAVNSTTGALTQVTGSPFSTTSAPIAVTFSPVGNLLAVVSPGTPGEISVYSVNTTTGALTQVSGSPFSAGGATASVAFSPNGAFLAAGNVADATVSVFAVNSSTGALTAVTGSPFATGSGPRGVAFSADGGFLAVGNFNSNSVSMFSVNSTTGALTAVSGSPYAAGSGPFAVAFSPTGLLAVADTNGPTVSVFSVDSGTGALTAVAGSPFTVGFGPDGVAFGDDGGLLGTANSGDSTASVLAVGSPTATIATPATAGNYAIGASVATSFTCAESTFGPGLSSCVDSDGSSSGTGALNTTSAGTDTYTVTATSDDGQSTAQTLTYTVGPPTSNPDSRPTISGTVQVGHTLTADTTGAFAGANLAYTYQWQDCTGATCTNVASGGTSSSYTPVAGDVGDTIEVVVTATNDGGTAAATSTATLAVLDATPTTNPGSPPTIGGTAQVGQTLTVDTTGAFTGANLAYTYQWQDCSGGTCTNVATGGTSSSYTPVAGDVGDTIEVVVTATNDGGSTAATSAATSAVLDATPNSNTDSPPTISGTAKVGQPLTVATTGAFTGANLAYSYQWQDCTGVSCLN
ncbi:MAG: beta-propeller fold lactonase family protein, partial [Solirubrobacteraceae bacterium]